MEHYVKFYPVGTADCTLIKLANDKTVIVDCQFKSDLTDEKGKQIHFDVKKDLLEELGEDSYGHPMVDLFISTHPHDDHCLGFGDNFLYDKAPADYDEEKDKDKIVIGELWITPIGLKNDISEEAANIRKEAKRRRKLYIDDTSYEGEEGNYLHIIGYDGDKEYDSRYGYVSGTLVDSFNGEAAKYLELFIHAPFKDDISLSKEQNDKNASSIVIQCAFYVQDDTNVKSRMLLGGDAEHDIWQHIIDNNEEDEKLKWNIFLAPHHCSWTFFNDTSNKKDIKQSAKDIMDKQIGDKSYVVASSKKISGEDADPPCIEAKKQYEKLLKDSNNFVNTAVDHLINDVPQPIVFKIDSMGKRKEENSNSSNQAAVSRPVPRAGKE